MTLVDLALQPPTDPSADAHGAWHDAGSFDLWNGPVPPDIEPCWCPIGKDHDAGAKP